MDGKAKWSKVEEEEEGGREEKKEEERVERGREEEREERNDREKLGGKEDGRWDGRGAGRREGRERKEGGEQEIKSVNMTALSTRLLDTWSYSALALFPGSFPAPSFCCIL